MLSTIKPTARNSIGLSQEQAELLDSAARFCRDKSPMSDVRALLEDARGYRENIWQEIAELGWLGIGIPEDYGGIDLPIGALVPIVEQMGRHLLTTPFVSSVLAGQLIVSSGRDDQKADYLPKIASGTPATIALCEEHADWYLENITCKATRDGDMLVLSGAKYLVADAQNAELIIASIQLEADASPALVLLEPAQFDKDAFERETVIDETRRSYAITLDGVRVPISAVLERDACKTALAHIERVGALLLAAEMCGGTYSVIDTTLDYLRTRKQFGKPIGAYQSLKHAMVDAHLAYERARTHLYSAAHLFDQQGEGDMAVHMAKAEANEAFYFAGDRAVQFHGGFGFTYECDAQLYLRRAIWSASLFGSTAYHRRKLAALML